MKVVIILVLTFVAADCNINVGEYSQELLSLTKELHQKCKARTNVPDEDIEAHKNGNFAINDESLKKYISCLWIESKIINENLEVDVALLYRLMPARFSSYLVPVYLDCLRLVRMTVPNRCSLENRTFFVSQCIYYRDPSDWIFF